MRIKVVFFIIQFIYHGRLQDMKMGTSRVLPSYQMSQLTWNVTR